MYFKSDTPFNIKILKLMHHFSLDFANLTSNDKAQMKTTSFLMSYFSSFISNL